jgi:hypothetical protein
VSVNREGEWESPSLKWIHEVRAAQYRATSRLPLKDWLKPVDAEEAARACRRLGLKVRLGETARRRSGKKLARMLRGGRRVTVKG